MARRRRRGYQRLCARVGRAQAARAALAIETFGNVVEGQRSPRLRSARKPRTRHRLLRRLRPLLVPSQQRPESPRRRLRHDRREPPGPRRRGSRPGGRHVYLGGLGGSPRPLLRLLRLRGRERFRLLRPPLPCFVFVGGAASSFSEGLRLHRLLRGHAATLAEPGLPGPPRPRRAPRPRARALAGRGLCPPPRPRPFLDSGLRLRRRDDQEAHVLVGGVLAPLLLLLRRRR
mmetsp:Transcript_13595/g.41065  ORF Transcript_13595/g.41065 Transcript_13595/m.41065 type:complete len:231 (-) Transcript_13595:1203-1895(-)